MKPTTWNDYTKKHPLSTKAKSAYEAEREAMGVGLVILTARSEAGMSQAELATAIGTSQPTIARWESGRQVPSVRSMMRIAEATGFELAVGLHRPKGKPNEFTALEVIRTHRAAKRGAA